MGDVTPYLLVLAIVFGINLLPALGPPTWPVLVWFRLHEGLAGPVLVLEGVLGACAGRFLLAKAFGGLRHRVSARTQGNLAAARRVLLGSTGRDRASLVFFVLSPVPSAQMFEAAGLVGARLVRLTLAFGVGRCMSYSVYVGTAAALEGTGLGRLVRDNLTSPWGIAVQAVLLAGLLLIARLNWRRWLPREEEDAA